MKYLRDVNSMGAFFSVLVNGENVTNAITINGCEIVDQEDRIRTLTFTLKNGAFWSQRIARYHEVQFYGGSMDDRNRKWCFKGKVKKLDFNYPAMGSPELIVNCFGGAQRGGTRGQHVVYPQMKSGRDWAQKETIKLSEIVHGILDETFPMMEHDVDIEDKNDKVFTLKKPYVQKSTDWMALRDLAKMSGCILAETDSGKEGGEHRIVFVDRNKHANIKMEDSEYPTVFRHIERETRATVQNKLYFEETDERFKTKELSYGEIPLENTSFVQNVDLNSGSMRIVSDFSEQTGGESKVYLQQFVERDKDEEPDIITYELKPQSFFDSLSDAEIRNMDNKLWQHFDDVTLDEILKYFQPVDLTKQKGYEADSGSFAGAGPLGTIGYEITADIIGDVNIQPYRYYPVYGLGKFSSNPKGGKKYYLRSITSKFTEQGFMQSLSFYR